VQLKKEVANPLNKLTVVIVSSSVISSLMTDDSISVSMSRIPMDELDGIHRCFQNPDMRTVSPLPMAAPVAQAQFIARKLTKLWQLSLCRFLALVFYLAISYVEYGVYPVSKQSLEQNHGKQASISGARAVDPSQNGNIYDTVLMTVNNLLWERH
jgi:hypothetical protein